MKPDSSKNQKLVKQYPFVSEILSEQMDPYNGAVSEGPNDLVILVQKADADLMFKRANNAGLGESNSCILSTSGPHKEHIMKRGEYAFAIDDSGKIINRLNWPKDRDEERKLKGVHIYVRHLFFTERQGFVFSKCIADEVKFIVWVSVGSWHENIGCDFPTFGKLLETKVQITIYKEPAQGFYKLMEEATIFENMVVDSPFISRGIAERDTDAYEIMGMLGEMCINFQDEVFFNGLKEILDESEYRGVSGQLGGVGVLCGELCGYNRVTLQDSQSFITFQLRPDAKRMYVLGQSGTLPQLRNLVRTAVKKWGIPKERNSFKEDANISFI